jgi:hypothetical protein
LRRTAQSDANDVLIQNHVLERLHSLRRADSGVEAAECDVPDRHRALEVEAGLTRAATELAGDVAAGQCAQNHDSGRHPHQLTQGGGEALAVGGRTVDAGGESHRVLRDCRGEGPGEGLEGQQLGTGVGVLASNWVHEEAPRQAGRRTWVGSQIGCKLVGLSYLRRERLRLRRALFTTAGQRGESEGAENAGGELAQVVPLLGRNVTH